MDQLLPERRVSTGAVSRPPRTFNPGGDAPFRLTMTGKSVAGRPVGNCRSNQGCFFITHSTFGPRRGQAGAKRIMVPRPGSLDAAISPPCATTRLLAIASPSTVPRESFDL